MKSFISRAYQPQWLHTKLVPMGNIPGLRWLLLPAYKLWAEYLGLKKMTPEEAATSLTSVYATRYWHSDKVPKWLRDLKDQGQFSTGI